MRWYNLQNDNPSILSAYNPKLDQSSGEGFQRHIPIYGNGDGDGDGDGDGIRIRTRAPLDESEQIHRLIWPMVATPHPIQHSVHKKTVVYSSRWRYSAIQYVGKWNSYLVLLAAELKKIQVQLWQ